MRRQGLRQIGLCALACVLLAGSAAAQDWRVPGIGVMTLPPETQVAEKAPASATGRLETKLHRHGIYGSDCYLLRGRDDANFFYAWAARIPMDAAFVRTERVPVRSAAAAAVNPATGVPLPLLTRKQSIREVPSDRSERMARAAALVQELWGTEANTEIRWTNADKKGAVLQADWTHAFKENGVAMPQQYRAWLLDRQNTVELFVLVTDTHHPAWTEALVEAWQQRRESRSRYFS